MATEVQCRLAAFNLATAIKNFSSPTYEASLLYNRQQWNREPKISTTTVASIAAVSPMSPPPTVPNNVPLTIGSSTEKCFTNTQEVSKKPPTPEVDSTTVSTNTNTDAHIQRNILEKPPTVVEVEKEKTLTTNDLEDQKKPLTHNPKRTGDILTNCLLKKKGKQSPMFCPMCVQGSYKPIGHIGRHMKYLKKRKVQSTSTKKKKRSRLKTTFRVEKRKVNVQQARTKQTARLSTGNAPPRRKRNRRFLSKPAWIADKYDVLQPLFDRFEKKGFGSYLSLIFYWVKSKGILRTSPSDYEEIEENNEEDDQDLYEFIDALMHRYFCYELFNQLERFITIALSSSVKKVSYFFRTLGACDPCLAYTFQFAWRWCRGLPIKVFAIALEQSTSIFRGVRIRREDMGALRPYSPLITPKELTRLMNTFQDMNTVPTTLSLMR